MKPIIEIHDLSKHYYISTKKQSVTIAEVLEGFIRNPLSVLRQSIKNKQKFWALKNINFSASKGETIGIIGRNGSGKSTLLKILARITSPTTGRITLRGSVGSLLEAGTGFQPELTGRENIFLSAAVLGIRKKRIEQKFNEIVTFSGIKKFLDTPIKHYSSGMYVRLAFSVAVQLEPSILLVDEALAVGDAAFQKKCLAKMKSIARKGRTIFFVSHNLVAIENLCQRCILLEAGKIRFIGKTTECIDFYHQLR